MGFLLPHFLTNVGSIQVLTVSADKSAKVWEICDDGNGKVHSKVKKTLVSPGSGGVDDMLVGCLWQNDHLVTVSLGGTISLFSASDLEKAPLSFSGHMKNINSLAVIKSNPKIMLSCSYDGLIVKWIQGIGYCGRLERKVNSQIKCFAAVDEEIVTSSYDNTVISIAVHIYVSLYLDRGVGGVIYFFLAEFFPLFYIPEEFHRVTCVFLFFFLVWGGVEWGWVWYCIKCNLG